MKLQAFSAMACSFFYQQSFAFKRGDEKNVHRIRTREGSTERRKLVQPWEEMKVDDQSLEKTCGFSSGNADGPLRELRSLRFSGQPSFRKE